MSDTSKDSYKNILKATSIFGGVQVINIVIQILKSKAVAVLIGASGMGILGLINQAVSLISAATNFGLETSAVKNISYAEASGDQKNINETVSLLQKLVFYTGTLGFLTCLFLSPLLSEIVFNNKEYTVAFVIVSISLLFMQLTAGQNALLQGLRKIQLLAKANILSSLVGLLVAIPIYYFYGIKGIPVSIAISSLAVFLITFIFARKVHFTKVSFNKQFFKKEGIGMMKLGFLLSLSGLISIGSSLIIRIFISNTGAISDVGLYNAGFAIIEGYVGIIFTAMAKDYYPRLSMVSNNIDERNNEINQQTEIAILLLIPILTIFLLFLNIIILILYTKEFLAVMPMIKYAILGMFLRAISWSMGYLLLAKGDSKVFFWSEMLSTFYVLILNILGYKYFGLKGIGIAFILIYLFHTIQIFVTVKILYKFKFNNELIKYFNLGTLLITCQFIITSYVDNVLLKYSLGISLVVIALLFAYKKLDNKLEISKFIKNKIKK